MGVRHSRTFVDSKFYSFIVSQLRYWSYFCLCMRSPTSPRCLIMFKHIALGKILSFFSMLEDVISFFFKNVLLGVI